jgi:hypothetical protein
MASRAHGRRLFPTGIDIRASRNRRNGQNNGYCDHSFHEASPVMGI